MSNLTEKGAGLNSKSRLLDMSRPLPSMVIPDRYYLSYYDVVSNSGPLYVVLSINEGESSLYFSKNKEGEFVSYVFYRISDANKYLKTVRTFKGEDVSALVLWGGTASILANSYSKVLKKEKSGVRGQRKLKAVSSVFINDRFVDLELFWVDDNLKIN